MSARSRRLVGVVIYVGLLLPTIGAARALTATNPLHGTHTVNVVLVEGRDGARSPRTRVDVIEIIRGVDEFWSSISGGRIRFKAGKVFSWRPAPPGRPCELDGVRDFAHQLGVHTSVRSHMVLLQAIDDPSCPAGYGSIDGPYLWMADVGYVPTSVPGHGRPDIAELVTVMAHELGHNLGLDHTRTPGCSVALYRMCTVTVDDRDGEEYGGSDVMGAGGSGLNPLALQTLGLLPRQATMTVNLRTATERTVTLAPSDATSGVRALRLVYGRQVWWLSYRRDPLGGHGRVVVHGQRDGQVYEYETQSRALRRDAGLAGVGDRDPVGLLEGASYAMARGVLTVASLTDTATLVLSFPPPVALTVSGTNGALTVGWDPSLLTPGAGFSVDLLSTVTPPPAGPADPGRTDGVSDSDARSEVAAAAGDPDPDAVIDPAGLRVVSHAADPAAGVFVFGHLTVDSYWVVLRSGGRVVAVSAAVMVTPAPDDQLPVAVTVDGDGAHLTFAANAASGRVPTVIRVSSCRATGSGSSTRTDSVQDPSQSVTVAGPLRNITVAVTVSYTDGLEVQFGVLHRGRRCP